MPPAQTVQWQPAKVTSPSLDQPVAVVIARDVPYISNANRFQTFSFYLPNTPETTALIGGPVGSLPKSVPSPGLPRCHVHIHGGAWRDPELTSASIEPTVAHAFRDAGASSPIAAIVGISYTLSQFQTHPTLPYDAIKDNHKDRAREAVHPQHVSDVLNAFALLREFGLGERSYILSGHSCGACLALQCILQPTEHYGLAHLPEAPCPAAILGLNGLYDLPALVLGLGSSHEHLRDDYDMFLTNAFGADKSRWPAASPARFDPARLAERVQQGKAPPLIVLDQSAEDQLVPLNQRARLEANLLDVAGLRVVRGRRCTGRHAAPWEQGGMIWDSVQDILKTLEETQR